MEKSNNKKVLFKIRNLKKYFPIKKKSIFSRGANQYVHANESISIDIHQGETFGLVGESGCGKSTFGRTILQIYEQTEGTTLYYGTTLDELAPEYMGKDIKDIAKKFPEYEKEVEKLNSIYSEIEKTEDEEKKAELNESAMFQRRHIQENYENMLRIAGGLLADDDLSEVSSILDQYYQKIKERSKIILEIKKIKEKDEVRIRDKKELKNTLINDPKYKELLSRKEKLDKEVSEKKANIDYKKEELKAKDSFEKLESFVDDGIDLSRLTSEEMRELRKDLQIIFQDPYGSLDTKMTVGNIIGEGVLGHGLFKNRKEEGYNEYIQDVMGKCGLAPYFIHRYPHQFSGGQRQRIGIARALALNPSFIVCDEAVSALDVSIQSQIINLLQDLKTDLNLTYLFITHDLSVVKYISDRIGVMYLGVMVELSDSDKIFANPQHPYTKALLQAIPRTDVDKGQELQTIEGDIPSAVNPPKGCRFHTRCKYCMDICKQFEPELKEVEEGHFVACHLMDVSEETKIKAFEENEEKRLKKERELAKEANL
ncbi:ATP-binding cassette domain-containing protein [Anaerococcus sp. AGMB00486]|uniref:ATP-binding cassette domain-containing protein n=2 Tax=Anaerococcus TaxID=165779 RepID=A0ABX2N9B2_9FIRM|nr:MULTISPECIES: oligopeptide/dipeptide ABC transporter ATP-binding protein [Anaerococcus]MDY3005863.1 oligopeptide/dipeptide ABC transporter ATP-binding protein [Anaerococcus porci]MSS77603.1 ATP-binding cassette domain-containing protein [Anaerococcus porci]NVF11276.1 ATP-binding cassette domain-containing protein [Anaerococcus faecalis]